MTNRRLELLLVVLIVVAAAWYTQAEYIPAFSERHVENAEEKYNLDVGEPGPWFSAWSIGDGQAFTVIAADPTGVKLSEEIKEAAYRYSRAGFGWLAAAASFGREAWIPYGMPIVGVVSLAAITWLAISLRGRLGPRIWILVLNPAIYLGFAGDTAEPLGVLFLTYAIATGSVWVAAALGVTRPSYLVGLLEKWRQVGVGALATGTILTYGLIRFGAEDFLPDGGRVDIPFRAYFEYSTLGGWLVALAATATFAIGIRKRDWAWIGSGVLIVCLGTDVTANPVNVWRAAGMIPVLWAFGPGFKANTHQSPDLLEGSEVSDRI